MALIEAAADLEGDGILTAAAAVQWYGGSVPLFGDTDIVSDVARILPPTTVSMEGDTDIPDVDPLVTLFASSAMVGVSAFSNTALEYLLTTAVAGDAAVASQSEMAYSGQTSLAGEGEVETEGKLTLGGATSVAGDASTTTAAAVAYVAETSLVGDADVSATALANNESAADLVGDAQAEGSATMFYRGAGGFAGQSSFVAYAIIPQTVANPNPPRQLVDQFPGLQVGREPPEILHRSVVEVDPERIRRRR